MSEKNLFDFLDIRSGTGVDREIVKLTQQSLEDDVKFAKVRLLKNCAKASVGIPGCVIGVLDLEDTVAQAETVLKKFNKDCKDMLD